MLVAMTIFRQFLGVLSNTFIYKKQEWPFIEYIGQN